MTPSRSSSRKRLASAQAEEATKRPRKAPANKPKPARASGRKKEPEDAGRPAEDDVCAEEPDEEEMAMGEEDAEEQEQQAAAARKRVAQPSRVRHTADGDREPEFHGDPFPVHAARAKARCHYSSAKVDGTVYSLNDDVYVKAGENEPDYIGRITEFFEGTDRGRYFTCRWFFRPVDTVISTVMSENIDDHKHDLKRVFLSEEKNDNALDCIISKVKIVHIDPNMDPEAKAQLVADCELYYDMSYTVAYSTFANIPSASVEYAAAGALVRCYCDVVLDVAVSGWHLRF